MREFGQGESFGREVPLNLAAKWLEKSIDPSTGGSRANYSRLFNGIRGWSGPYPETTGYIIPTFLRLAETRKEWRHLRESAIRMGEWLMSIQHPDGAFPGNIFVPGRAQSKSIFNTGQIILGLTTLFDKTNDERPLVSAWRAAKWLAETQTPLGTWESFNYVDGFSPSYYTRVAWPMLKVHQRRPDAAIESAALLALECIQRRRLANGYITGCGFNPSGYAFLHTVDYTIRGFLESSILSKNADWWDCGFVAADVLRRKFELRGRLHGAYFPDFSGVTWYQCLTGNAQIAISWIKIYQQTGDLRFLSAASKAIDSVVNHQRGSSYWNPDLRGAIPGSAPIFGRYMAMRYPNWAAKFFLDAIMAEEEAVNEIRKT